MKARSAGTTGNSRTPPEPAADGAAIDSWLERQMPDLQPIVRHLDELIRSALPRTTYAVKWKKAYYGTPNHGWVVELVAYDVSVNLVFLGGAAFDDPPPSGSGDGRYVKLRTVEEAGAPQIRAWLDESARTRGWR